MKFCRWFPLLLATLLPVNASALTLRWASGADTISFSQPTRCVLVVAADSLEVSLPPEWRLLWLADSSGVNFVPEGVEAGCASDTARVSTALPPATAADSAAHLLTTQFCSAGSAEASLATFVLDQPGGSRARFKIVAMDPNDPDSTTVIESNEVISNGGIDGYYSPVVLHASSVHQSLQLEVTVTGLGLESANSLSIVAPDSSWSLPLSVTSRSDASITGVASVAAILPACRAEVGSVSGAVAAADIPAESEPANEGPLSCSAQYFEELVLPPPPNHGYTIQPKDFSFTRGYFDGSDRYAFHLFYTRQSYYDIPGDAQSKNLGHIWTTDFNSWYGPNGLNKADTTAIVARSGKFDERHVWAPTIVQNGPIFSMFYTGVRREQPQAGVFRVNQRIGRATSTDLIHWTQADDPVLTSPQIPWASKNPIHYDGQQLRDPFVMPDPVTPGRWLMYFVAVDSIRAPKMAVGVATSENLVDWTAYQDPFSATERPTPQGPTTVVESPHVFRRNGQWWMPYTVNGDQVFFETTQSADPTDTIATSWSDPVRLRVVAEGDPSELQYWHASEHLRIPMPAEYLAAFNDNATSIEIKGIFPPADATVDSFRLDCPLTGVRNDEPEVTGGVRLSLVRQPWGASDVRLRIDAPARMAAKLAVYDIAGRRLDTILDGELSAGTTETTWSTHSRGGARAPSGIYFLRLTYAGGVRVSKIVMIR